MKKINVVAAQRDSAHQAIRIAPIFLLAFIYSYLVSEPVRHMNSYDWQLQLGHYQAVTAYRWWFFAGFVILVAAGFYGLHRASAARAKSSTKGSE